MRTRAEIEAEAKFWSEAEDMLLRRILEVLLDIRGLLAQPPCNCAQTKTDGESEHWPSCRYAWWGGSGMTGHDTVELLLRKIEDVCFADNIHDDAKRQEAIFQLAHAHQKVMKESRLAELKTTDSPHFLVLCCLPTAEDGQWFLVRQWMPDQEREARIHAQRLTEQLPDGSQVAIAEVRTYAIVEKSK